MCQAVLIDRGLDLFFDPHHYLFSFQGVSLEKQSNFIWAPRIQQGAQIFCAISYKWRRRAIHEFRITRRDCCLSIFRDVEGAVPYTEIAQPQPPSDEVALAANRQVNDSPVDCQSRKVTEPQRDGGKTAGFDAG